MLFVENGEGIIKILIELGKDRQYAEFVASVRKLYLPFVQNVEAIKTKMEGSGSISNLTARELEIAKLVAAGLSNHKIAENLHIADITAKKTLQSIYSKLGISGRTVLTRMVMEEKVSGDGNTHLCC